MATSPGDGASVVSVNVSLTKGVRKNPAGAVMLVESQGIEGDAHAEGGIRQVSLLAIESIEKMRAAGLDVHPGDFAENITTIGIDLLDLPIGTRLLLSRDVLVEISQIGKICPSPCAIYEQAGDCVMPREGIFARVLRGGELKPGDPIRIVQKETGHA